MIRYGRLGMSCGRSRSFRCWLAIFGMILAWYPAVSQGELLVSDRATNRVLRFEESTGVYLGDLIGNNPEVNGGLFGPSAMAIGPEGSLWVASQLTGQVLRYDIQTGQFLGEFANQLNGPSGLLYDAARDILHVSTIGNFDSELVMQYRASSGEFLGTVGGGTGGTGRTSVVLGPDDQLYVNAFATDANFSGAVLRFDSTTLESKGLFASLPGLSGAADLSFYSRGEGEYFLDVVGLFSNTVARFDVGPGETGELANRGGQILVLSLDFPSAILHREDHTFLVSNLGNDNPATGELRPGSIGQFDVATGTFLKTFIAGGGEAGLSQPTDLLVYRSLSSLDCNGDGQVNGADLDCACAAGTVASLLENLRFVAGDLDLNGEVAFADFLVLSQNYGTAAGYRQGDLDCSGQIAFADFLILANNYGIRSMDRHAQAVPEPTWIGTGIMLGIVALCCGTGRRGRRSA